MHNRGGRRVLIVHLEEEQYNLFGIVSNERGKPVPNALVEPENGQPQLKQMPAGTFILKGVKAAAGSPSVVKATETSSSIFISGRTIC